MPAEFELLLGWQPILEAEVKGTTCLYLTLQTFVNRQPGHPKQGKAWPGISRLSQITHLSKTTVWRAQAVLVKHGFISVESGKATGVTNSVTINELPALSDVCLSAIPVPAEEKVGDASAPPVNVFGDGLQDIQDIRRDQLEGMLRSLPEDEASWNTNDLIKYFRTVYELKYKVRPGGAVTGKERKHVKDLIDGFSSTQVRMAMDYAVENWANLSYVEGYPSIAALYGFRNTIFPEAEAGKLTANRRGQFAGVSKGDVVSW